MIQYELLRDDQIQNIKPLCDNLMRYQKSMAFIEPERFDGMRFETRFIPSYQNARNNFLIAVKNDETYVGYVYANISHKSAYDSAFATFFDMESVSHDYVGCLSQFYLDESYRGQGIGSELFNRSMEWLSTFKEIKDVFIYVSNGNTPALSFYRSKGFHVSHDILGGFITVMRNEVTI